MVRVREAVRWGLLAGALALAAGPLPAAPHTQKKQPLPTVVSVQAGQSGCQVDVDGTGPETTDSEGKLEFSDVLPGDHYLHIRCPGQLERTVFVSVSKGQTREVESPALPEGQSTTSPLDAAARRHELQGLVLKAVRLRARGEFDPAVGLLRQAAALDPKNADLHRELGITFLLEKDWARARVEMLEAIHHDPSDADAHNGLGYALEKLGKLAEAVQEYKQATHLDPDDDSYRQHFVSAQTQLAYQEYLKKKR